MDYGENYEYDFFYKNIFINITYKYGGYEDKYGECIWFRGDDIQEITLWYREEDIHVEDLKFLVDSFQFLLEKSVKYNIQMTDEKIKTTIENLIKKPVIKEKQYVYDNLSDNFFECHYRFDYNNIEVCVNITSENPFIHLRYAENAEYIDLNDIEFIHLLLQK